MKHIFYLTLFSSSVFSFDAYRWNVDSSICFYNLQTNGEVIISTYVQAGQTKELEAHVSWYNANTEPAYYYNSVCNDNPYDSGLDSNSTNDWEKLGLDESDYNFLMGLMANLLGFTLVFMVSFLFILQGRR